jgi:hypothetical protein
VSIGSQRCHDCSRSSHSLVQEFWQWVEGSHDKIVYLPGDMIVHDKWSATGALANTRAYPDMPLAVRF